jgi:FkbM family methyltransferase
MHIDIQSDSHQPLVSIGIPTYNRQKFLEEALHSVMNQTYPNLEIILSDNASSDKTQAFCHEMSSKDSRIKYIRQEHNLGAIRNFEQVFQVASGKYFMWVADDDKCEPECIEKLVDYLEANPSVVLCAPDFKVIDSNGSTIRIERLNRIYPASNGKQIQAQFFEYPTSNIFFAIYGLYRAKVLKRLGVPHANKWKGILASTEVPFLAKVATEGKIIAIPHILKFYRSHADSAYIREPQKLKNFDYLILNLLVRIALLKTIFSSSITLSEKVSLIITVLQNLLPSILKSVTKCFIPKPLIEFLKRKPKNENPNKKLARKMGVEISRYTPANSDMAKIQTMLAVHKIDLILDVGANAGQYAQSLRNGGYHGKMVSFEPLSSAHRELLPLSKHDPHWTIAPQVAIGKEEGETEIHISENSCSSSLLPMLATHLNAAPLSRYIGTERIKVRRLDTIASQYVNASQATYLKIDTQGFEEQVLEAAKNIIPQIKGIQLELSLVPLYEGQLLFVAMVNKLTGLGYELYGLLPGFTDNGTGRLLQVDGIFFRG